MLKRLLAKNYRCLADFELALEPATLLLGDQGGGKTTVIHLISELGSLIGSRDKAAPLSQIFPPRTRTRWAEAGASQRFELDIELRGGLYRYQLELVSPAVMGEPDGDEDDEDDDRDDFDDAEIRIKRESLHLDDRPLGVFADGVVRWYDGNEAVDGEFSDGGQRSLFAYRADVDKRPAVAEFAEFFTRMLNVRPDVSAINAQSAEENPAPGQHFESFGPWYRYLERTAPLQVAVFNRELTTILPGFVTLRLAQVGGRERRLMAVFKDLGPQSSPVEYAFEELSGGERTTIALYAIIHFMVRPGATVLMSNLAESCLRPQELQLWLTRLRERVAATDGAQFVLSVRNRDALHGQLEGAIIWLHRRATGPTLSIVGERPPESPIEIPPKPS